MNVENRVSVKKLSDTKVELTINISAEEFDIALDKAFDKVVKEVKVDGFRPGKLPKSQFIKRFGYQSLYQDAVEFIFMDTYGAALDEAHVSPVAEPQLDLDFNSLEKGQGFSYKAVVEVWPEVKLGEYIGVSVKQKSTRVTKKEVEEKIKTVLNDKTEVITKEAPAASGDIVVIDFEGFIDGVAFDGGKAENHELELGSNSFIPGFEDQLIGTKQGDSCDVNVVFPENYAEALSGKAAVFKCLVHEVKEKKYPELTDDLVKELDIKDVTTVKEYEEYIKKELTKEKENAAEEYLVSTILSKIVKASNIVVPNAILEREVLNQVENLEKQAKQYNLPTEMLLQYSGVKDLEEFKSITKKRIKNQIEEEIVISEVIRLENIKVEADEIEKFYESLVNEKISLEEVKKQYSTEQVSHHLQVLNCIKFLKEKANLS